MSLWLNIIGVGEKGVGELPAHLRELVTEAFTVIGSFRFLATIAPSTPDVEVHPELVQQRSLEAVARALLYVDDEDITFVEEDLSRVLIECEHAEFRRAQRQPGQWYIRPRYRRTGSTPAVAARRENHLLRNLYREPSLSMI